MVSESESRLSWNWNDPPLLKTKWARADGGSVFAELWLARRTGCKILVRKEKCRKRGEERKEGRKGRNWFGRGTEKG